MTQNWLLLHGIIDFIDMETIVYLYHLTTFLLQPLYVYIFSFIVPWKWFHVCT